MIRLIKILSCILFAMICSIPLRAFSFPDGEKRDSKRTDQRVDELIRQLTLEEKAGLMLYNSPAIPRLGIPEYNWWSEALHGVARNGRATVFPQAIGLAATFDPDLVFRVATAVSDEARAKFKDAVAHGRRARYAGLSFWTPNINIFRDPRWGRGQETYGEDPYLTGVTGVAFVQGLQGEDPDLLKTAACAKHFAVHSGPEPDRHKFNAIVDETDLRETYLPAFKMLVDSGVEAVMCAYNRVNDEPCCGSNTLLRQILREEWGFKGHIVSDCWALDDIWARHKVVATRAEAAAMALKAGVNLNCGYIYKHLPEAVGLGLITEKQIDQELAPLLRTRFRLGLFDNDSINPWAAVGTDVVDSPEHRSLAREAAVRSIVLVKNRNNILPLKKDLNSLFITGPTAAEISVLLGNYNGLSQDLVTILEGIIGKVGNSCKVEYVKGTDLVKPVFDGWFLAGSSDATIVVAGLSPLLEGEEGDALLSDASGDRRTISLPENQVEFIKRLRGEHQKPVILVITGGSGVSLTEVEEYADAILYAWYPGEEGGNAVADIIFGDANPSGRLPVTVYTSLDDLPPFYDYRMTGRTYRYFKGKAEFPFGHGLSYSSFVYSTLYFPEGNYREGSKLDFTVNIRNGGSMKGEEVVQVYVRRMDAGDREPLMALKAFSRVDLEPGESKTIAFSVPLDEIRKWNADKHGWELMKGKYEVMVGASSEDIRLRQFFTVE